MAGNEAERLGAAVDAAAREMEHNGYHICPAPVSETDLQSLIREGRTGELIPRLEHNGEFMAFLHRLVEARLGRKLDPGLSFTILRDYAGDEITHAYHFDNFVVTAVVPVQVPADGGSLLLWPNARRLTRSVFRHLLVSALCQNPLARRVAKWLSRNSGAFRRATMKPGEMVVFWGFETLHGVEDASPDARRMVAVVNYYNPLKPSPLLNVLPIKHKEQYNY